MPRVDEKQTRWSGRISGLYFWKRYLIAAVLLAAGLADPGPLALGSLAPWLVAAGALLLGWTLATVFFGGRSWVTTEQVVQSTGVVSRHTSELRIGELQGVEVRQGWIERLLKIGSVAVSSQSRDSAVVLSGVRDPDALADLIREQNQAGGEDGPPGDCS